MVKRFSPKEEFPVRVGVGPPSLRSSSATAWQSPPQRAKAGKYMYYVYILKCKDGFYTGCTDDLKERIRRHQKEYIPATAERLPIKLVTYIACVEKDKAFKLEKYLKSGSGRAFLKRHF